MQTEWPQGRRLPLAVQWALIALAFPVGFVGFMMLGALVSRLLGLVIPDRSLCQVVGFLVFVQGLVSAGMYAFLMLCWLSAARLVPTRRSRKEQIRQHLSFAVIFMLVAVVCFVLPVAIGMPGLNQTPLARAAGAVLSLMGALAVAWDFGRRISQYDYVFARPPEEPANRPKPPQH
jgi:hypothetical protein